MHDAPYTSRRTPYHPSTYRSTIIYTPTPYLNLPLPPFIQWLNQTENMQLEPSSIAGLLGIGHVLQNQDYQRVRQLSDS
ncbi:hypothetical protein, partial [Acinetobacter soli]